MVLKQYLKIYRFRAVLTSKRRGQIPLKDLWFRKVELAESLRILKDLEMLRNTPSVVLRSIEQRRWSLLSLYLIISYLIPSHLLLSYHISSHLISSYIIMSSFVSSRHNFNCLFGILYPWIALIWKIVLGFISKIVKFPSVRSIAFCISYMVYLFWYICIWTQTFMHPYAQTDTHTHTHTRHPSLTHTHTSLICHLDICLQWPHWICQSG